MDGWWWLWLLMWFLPALVGLFARRAWISALLIALNLAALFVFTRDVGAGLNVELALYPTALVLTLYSRWRARRDDDRAAARAQLAKLQRLREHIDRSNGPPP